MSRYLDQCANLERSVRRRNLLLGVLLVIVLLQASSFGRLVRIPPPIAVVPGTTAPGIYGANGLVPEVARQFAESYVLALGNFTPETVRSVYDRSLRFLAPAAASRVRSGLETELARITRGKIACQFTLTGEIHVQPQDQALQLIVPGRKRIFAGRELISDTTMAYHLLVSHVPATPTNLYGLQIEELRQESQVAAEPTGARS
jgi:hypothetical protein